MNSEGPFLSQVSEIQRLPGIGDKHCKVDSGVIMQVK